MRKIRKTMIVSMIMILSSLTLVLSGCRFHSTPEKRMERFSEHVADELDLTPTQKEQLDKSVARLYNKRDDMKKARQAIFDEMLVQLGSEEVDQSKLLTVINENKATMETMIPEFVEELAAFHKTLTPEQRAKLVTELEDKRKRFSRYHH